MEKFWAHVMLGAKGICFFKYGGYVPDDGNWFTTHPNRTAGALQAVRELSQVRDLVTYSDVSSAVTCPSGTTARLLVGKNQVLVVMIKTSSSGSVNGNLVVTMPSWIPISATPDANFNVYRVDQNGMTAQSYTAGSGTVTIPFTTVAGDASRLFVVGQPDTEAPAQPRNLCVADRGATGVANKFTLCWNEPWDNLGVKGYKVYNNGVEEGDVRYPMYRHAGPRESLRRYLHRQSLRLPGEPGARQPAGLLRTEVDLHPAGPGRCPPSEPGRGCGRMVSRSGRRDGYCRRRAGLQ